MNALVEWWSKLRGKAQDKLPLSHSVALPPEHAVALAWGKDKRCEQAQAKLTLFNAVTLDKPGMAALIGAAGSGKSYVMETLIEHTAGPVIVIGPANHELSGAADAPFTGDFLDRDGVEHTMELSEMLQNRPAGVFNLLVPRSWRVGTAQGESFQEQLTQLLSTSASSEGLDVSVFLMDADALLAPRQMERLAPFVRSNGLKLTASMESSQAVERCLTNLSQLVVLRVPRGPQVAQLAHAMGVQAHHLEELKGGWAMVRRASVAGPARLIKLT